MKCLLLISNSAQSKHKAGFIVFHPERNNIISKFCPLTNYSWIVIKHISDFGLIYVPPRTKRKFRKEPGYIYVIGGYDNVKKKFLRQILRYDLIRGEWFHCAKMVTRRAGFTPFLYDGKIFFAGGQTSKVTLTSSVEYYEPVMDVVYEAKPLLKQCSHYACVYTKKCVFLIGGNIQLRNGIITPSSHFWSLQKCLEDPSEETSIPEEVLKWFNVRQAEVPIKDGIIGHKAVLCEESNRIYIIGGTNRNIEIKTSIAGLYYTNVENVSKGRLEDNNIIWYKRSIMEMQRSNCGVSLINNKIFVIGGVTNKFNSTFSIAEVNEEEQLDNESMDSQSNETAIQGDKVVKHSNMVFMPVNESIGYYDWRRKLYCEMFALRHGEDMDLENVHSVVIDMEPHYAEFKNDSYDWLLQWPLW